MGMFKDLLPLLAKPKMDEMEKLLAEIDQLTVSPHKFIVGVDPAGAGKSLSAAVGMAKHLGVLREVTPADIDRSVRMVGGDFLWAGEPWSTMSEEVKRNLCAAQGHMIEDAIFRAGADRARQREAEMMAKAVADEQERKEFLAYCEAQHPVVLEEFRRVRLVKSKFVKFAGHAEEP